MRVVAPEVRAASRRSRGLMNGQSLSSNSWTGSSSTAVTPSHFRYGIFSTRPAKVPGCATPAGRVAGEAADVQLVDDGVFERGAAAGRRPPSRSAGRGGRGCGGWCGAGRSRRLPAQTAAVREHRRGRVEQDDGRVEAVAGAASGRPRASRSRTLRGRPCDADVPVVAGAVLLRVERRSRRAARPPSGGQDDERDGGAVPAEEGEVDPVGCAGTPSGSGRPRDVRRVGGIGLGVTGRGAPDRTWLRGRGVVPMASCRPGEHVFPARRGE